MSAGPRLRPTGANVNKDGRRTATGGLGGGQSIDCYSVLVLKLVAALSTKYDANGSIVRVVLLRAGEWRWGHGWG